MSAAVSAATHPTPSNYQYWREHGGHWADEYARRKTWMVLYHIQEIMLTEYVLRHAEGRAKPLRVLEFGCGVGRHLRNLNRLANVEVYGFDQSAAMVEGCRRWADADFLRERVTVGEPTGALPYDDDSFDLVYSAEVLVHVRPEDISNTLSELLRIAHGQVLHIEPSPDFEVDGTVHDGCWNHDLPALYRTLGHDCEALGRGYRAHSAWRVPLAEPPVFAWKPELLDLYQKMETDIDRGFTVTDNAKKDAEARSTLFAARAAELERDHTPTLASLRSATAAVETTGAALLATRRDMDEARTHAEEARANTQAALDRKGAELVVARSESAVALAAAAERAEAAGAAHAAESERAMAAHASAVAELTERVNALEGELNRALAARERERTTEALDAQARSKGWSETIDRLREEARAARAEAREAAERHAALMNSLRGVVR